MASESKVLTSKFGDVSFPEDLSLWQFIQVFNTQFLDRVAMIEEWTGRQYTYSEFFAKIRNLRSGLYSIGVRKGDVLLTSCENSIDTPLVYFAVWSLGAVITGCAPNADDEALEHCVTTSGAKWVITMPEKIERFKTLNKKLNQIEKIIIYGQATQDDVISFSTLLDYTGARAPAISVQPKEDLAAIVYTSGTTGLAKAVLLTHYALLTCNRQFSHEFVYNEETPGTETCVLFFVLYGNWTQTIFIQCFHQAQTIVMMQNFALENYLKVIQKYKATKLHMQPLVATLMARHPLVSKYDQSSVRNIVCGCAVMSIQLGNELQARFPGTLVRSAFGMLETAGCTFFPTKDDIRPGSTGILLPGVKVQIVDIETGVQLGANEPGEMWIHTPSMMKGYKNLPEVTAKALDNEGWLHTGDYCMYDEDGHVYIWGRISELLTNNGKKFAPCWFEDILAEHPSVLELVVLEVPAEPKNPEQPSSEMQITAFVVKKDGMEHITKEELEKLINTSDKLPACFEGDVKVKFTPRIPRSDAFKFLKRILLEEVKSKVVMG